MADRISFSGLEQSLEQIANHYATVEEAVFEYFSLPSDKTLARYAGVTLVEARGACLDEMNQMSAFAALSSIEASMQMDYLVRTSKRRRDDLSRSMWALHQEKGSRVNLERDLIPRWREHTTIPKRIFSELVSVLQYRHWLAHGRWWTPKFGRTYDFYTVYEIGVLLMEVMAGVPK